MKQKKLSRREFLRLAATSTGAIAIAAVSPSIAISGAENTKLSSIPKLNPGFRIKELSADSVELFTNTGNNNIIRHTFTGMEADIFRLIDGKSSVKSMIHDLSKTYKLKNDEGYQKVNKILMEYEQARLIYYGGPMVVKISEVRNAQ